MTNKISPFKEIGHVCKKFGWETKLCEMSQEQIEVLIYAIQQTTPIEEEIPIDRLEENYFRITGNWPTNSTIIPF
jgi:hypothetical protein|tara:strand:- start:76 stop:300 length:225 start_codon:yes stop_codon:yes gene_type:complete